MTQQLFYLALSGLDAVLQRSAAAANNLANRNTTAFKAQRPVFEALPLTDQGLPNRVMVAAGEDGADLRAGAIERTGRALDVAVKGDGWIAVQAKDGTIGLTRNGALAIAPGGIVETSDGFPVLGQGAVPITLPPLQTVTIGADGTISGALSGQNPNQIAALNRILLTNPPAAQVQRRNDGLFQTAAGKPQPDAAVRLEVGALEGSNADPIALMMSMIENTRMFELQTEMVRTAFTAGQGQNSPLNLT
ncbi:MAG TPA: flagellar basal body rod protein FlgF [Stellaceae bacterium]|nr:flagellar basal body rod protein FlgF [Stellaceae bacterium]